jgi:hypothetical protein
MIKHAKLWPFVRTLSGPVAFEKVPWLLNRGDIVISALSPLYARGIEAFGCGKAYIGPGYKETGYPWQCDLSPESMAEAIIACWEDYQKIDFRHWAATHHDEAESSRQRCAIYERYL